MKLSQIKGLLEKKEITGRGDSFGRMMDEGYNEAIDSLAEVEIELIEEEVVKVSSQYFVELGAKIMTAGPNSKEQVSPSRGLAKALCLALPGLVRVK